MPDVPISNVNFMTFSAHEAEPILMSFQRSDCLLANQARLNANVLKNQFLVLR